METDRQRRIKELVREDTWRRTAPLLVEALVPAVIAPEDAEWAGALSLEDSDVVKERFYDILAEAEGTEDGRSEEVSVAWGTEEAQFERLRLLLGEVGGAMALSLVGDGAVRVRPEVAAKRVHRLHEHFGTLDVYGLETEGGASIFEDNFREGWWELTVVGREWVAALRRLG